MARSSGGGGSSKRRAADMRQDREINKSLNDVHRGMGKKPPYDERVGNPQAAQRARAAASRANQVARAKVNAEINSARASRGSANGAGASPNQADKARRAAADRRDSAAVARMLRGR